MAKIMATHKRSTPEANIASRMHSAHEDPSAASKRHPDLTVASQYTHKPSPIDKLLDVFELFEQVLDHLPTYDVLHATRVCRAFQQNIKNSHRLQAKLFLAPDLTRKKWAVSPSGTLLSGPKAEYRIAAATSAGYSRTGEVACFTLHPAVHAEPRPEAETYRGIAEHARYYDANSVYRAHAPGFHYNEYAGIRDPIMWSTDQGAKASSLDNMLLTQPPTKEVWLVHSRHWQSWEGLHVINKVGVTFGDVFKAARALAAPVAGRALRSIMFCDGFVATAEAREAVEKAGELRSDDDPTRWVITHRHFELKEGGFEF